MKTWRPSVSRVGPWPPGPLGNVSSVNNAGPPRSRGPAQLNSCKSPLAKVTRCLHSLRLWRSPCGRCHAALTTKRNVTAHMALLVLFLMCTCAFSVCLQAAAHTATNEQVPSTIQMTTEIAEHILDVLEPATQDPYCPPARAVSVARFNIADFTSTRSLPPNAPPPKLHYHTFWRKISRRIYNEARIQNFQSISKQKKFISSQVDDI